MPGVVCGIDAVGYQANTHGEYDRSSGHQVLEDVIRGTNPAGHVGLIGVYFPQDRGAPDDATKNEPFQVPLGQAWNKGIGIEMGQAPVKQCNVYLRDLILAGRAKPERDREPPAVAGSRPGRVQEV